MPPGEYMWKMLSLDKRDGTVALKRYTRQRGGKGMVYEVRRGNLVMRKVR